MVKSKRKNQWTIYLLSHTYCNRKEDNGASNHYFPLQYLWFLEEKENDYDVPEVLLPDTSTLKATIKVQIQIGDAVITREKETVLFDNLQSSLIYLGGLCDEYCKIILDKKKL